MRSCQGIGSRCNPRRSLFLGQNFGPVPPKFAAQQTLRSAQSCSSSQATAEFPECYAPLTHGAFNSQEAPRPAPAIPNGLRVFAQAPPPSGLRLQMDSQGTPLPVLCSSVAEVVVACAGYGGRQGAAAEAVT